MGNARDEARSLPRRSTPFFVDSRAIAKSRSDISVSKNLCYYNFVKTRPSPSTCVERKFSGNGTISRLTSVTAAGADVAQHGDMTFATVVDRVRMDFLEMPELELTLPQAVRLWSLGMDDCRYVLDSLVDTGFLAWTPKRTVIRRGRDPLSRQDVQTADISVPVAKYHNKSVSKT